MEKSKLWTSKEIELLGTVYTQYYDDKELQSYFPNRSVFSIKRKASDIGLKRKQIIWTVVDDRNLIDIYNHHTLEELSSIFKVKKSFIYNKSKILNLPRKDSERKWNDTTISILCNGRNYKFISKYKGKFNELRVILTCPEGHNWDTDFNNFRRGGNCLYCVGCYAHTVEFIENELNKENYELITKKYKNAHTDFTIRCPEGHIFDTTWNTFQSGTRCDICSMKRVHDAQRFPFDYIKKCFSDSDYILLSTSYTNYNTRNLEYICKFHPQKIQKISFGNFIKGHGCKLCANDKLRNERKEDFSVVVNDFKNNGYFLISDQVEYLNCFSKLKFICEKHDELGIQENNYTSLKTHNSICSECSRELISGKISAFWKGGVTPLNYYLRSKITDWKNESAKSCNYRCTITNGNFDHIHHLHPFYKILDETLRECEIEPRGEIGNYTDEELAILENKCIDVHKKYPLGICLRKDIHKLFHEVYGYYDNTPEQFEEFKIRYFNGEFQEVS